jgi:hypothetical protein
MKANGLVGEYCQACATVLDKARVNPQRIIVLDSECARRFEQSGDAERLEGSEHHAPAIPGYKDEQESEQVKETVHADVKPAKAASRMFGKKR